MNNLNTGELALFFASLVICAALTYMLVTLRSRDTRNRRMRSFFSLCIMVLCWTLLNAVTVVINPVYFSIVFTVKLVFVCIVPFGILWFVLNYAESKLVNSRIVKALLIIIPFLDCLLMLTNPLHHLMFPVYNYPIPVKATLFWIHTGIDIFVLLIGYVILFRYIIINFKKRPVMLITGLLAVFVYALNFLYSTNTSVFKHDTTPVGVFITLILFAYSSYSSHMFHFKSDMLGNMIDYLPEIIVYVNKKGFIVETNTALGAVFNNFNVELGKTPLKDFINELHANLVSSAPEDLLDYLDISQKNDFTGVEGEINVIVSSGEIKAFALAWHVIYRRGVISGYIITLVDVSEYRKMISDIYNANAHLSELKELAEKASRAKNEFLARMSHEIRTPMNAVIGISEMLLSEDLKKHQLEYVEDIKISSLTLLNIINDILDISKIQAEKLVLVPVHYNFRTLIDNIASMARFLAKNKNLIFKLNMPDDAPLCLFGDDVRLRQVLMNLLGNAVKFTDEGYIRLSVSVSDDSIIFEISDTGIGVKPEELPRLFEAFEQADLEKNRYQNGTGLGLSISKALTELMDGSIKVESQYGHGTVFHVTIPKILGDEKQLKNTDKEEMVIYAPDARIIVVDDNKVNLNVSFGLLRLYKITADMALSGAQALEMIKRNKYDLIFMDHMMPEMDGIETTRLIREMGVEAPVIALTANAIVGVREMFLAAGMNDLLTKPIKKEELKRLLYEWLPKEKLIINSAKTDSGEKAKIDGKKGFWHKISMINEISMQTGLDRVSGQSDVYEKSLRLTIKEIKKCCELLTGFLAQGDLSNFRIETHSIKSSLANIGAMELASQASELENASERGDAGFCASCLPGFLTEIKGLGDKLKKAFAQPAQSEGSFKNVSDFFPVFEKLITAIEKYDFKLIDKEIKYLDTLNPDNELKEKIDNIKDAVLLLDYDTAIRIMNELMSAG